MCEIWLSLSTPFWCCWTGTGPPVKYCHNNCRKKLLSALGLVLYLFFFIYHQFVSALSGTCYYETFDRDCRMLVLDLGELSIVTEKPEIRPVETDGATAVTVTIFTYIRNCACDLHVHCVPKKHPNIFDCNLKTNYQILIIFCTNISDTTCHRMTFQFPTSPNVCFCTT